MKLTEYYVLTKDTTKNCLKYCGIIFTSISAIIWGISVVKNSSESIFPIIVFIISFLAGNTLGLFITAIAFMEGFKQVNNTICLYDSIPSDIKKQYSLEIHSQQLNPNHNYLKIQIQSTKPNFPLLIFERLTNPNSIRIIIIGTLKDRDFDKFRLSIDSKYQKEKITITGYGLTQTISLKRYQTLSSSDIEKSIQRLLTVSQKENLETIYI